MDYDTVIELDEVTLEDCIDLYEKKNIRTVQQNLFPKYKTSLSFSLLSLALLQKQLFEY